MRKRNKGKSPREKKSASVNAWYVFILILLFAIFVIGSQQITDHIKRSQLFLVKRVVVEPSADFPDLKEFAYLKGKNIFDVDPEALQARLRQQYPHIAYIRVIKRFPDTVGIVAIRRNPFAQIEIRRHMVVLDADGVVISDLANDDKTIPKIVGVKGDRRISVGSPINLPSVQVALTIIKIFRESPILAKYPVSVVDVENLAKINLTIGNNLVIILDREQVKQKFKILELMLSQSKIDLEKVKYMDLRFQEPVVGEKEAPRGKGK